MTGANLRWTKATAFALTLMASLARRLWELLPEVWLRQDSAKFGYPLVNVYIAVENHHL